MGMLLNTVEAAATLTVGTDAFRNERENVTSRPRVIDGVAIVGGNAIGEASVSMYAGSNFLGTYQSSLNGAVAILMPDHLQAVGPAYVAPGDKISGIIATAPTVSPLKIQVFGRRA